MQALSKTRVKREWFVGKLPLMQLHEDDKGKEYICLVMQTPMGLPTVEKTWITVDIKRMRMSELRKAALSYVDYHERGFLPDSALELLLDYIYGELNRRLNKEG